MNGWQTGMPLITIANLLRNLQQVPTTEPPELFAEEAGQAIGFFCEPHHACPIIQMGIVTISAFAVRSQNEMKI